MERAMSKQRQAGTSDVRTKVVWVSLLASMCVGFGVLWALGGGERARLSGRSLAPMVAAAGPSSLEAIFSTRAALDRQRWTSIVIHASGSPLGGPATIEADHRARSLRSLGHHFVIGNGRGFGDGEIYAGARWLDQTPGAHVAGPSGETLNLSAIGICLVGDGHREPFTEQQIRRLVQLVQTLARELDIPLESVYLHSEVAETGDPGRFFPTVGFRERLASAL